MSLDLDERYFSVDVASAMLDPESKGVTQDDDGITVDWDEVDTVDAKEAPGAYRDFFVTDRFYVVDAIVVRPIEQQYYINGDSYTFKKPRDELKKARATLDNSPWTLDHPSSGAARQSRDRIRGFWRDEGWDDEVDGNRASLHIPANDTEATRYAAKHPAVSVGFYNRLQRADEDGVDAYQTDIVYEHVASVKRGRCSREDGCGLDVDSAPHAHSAIPQTMSETVFTDSPPEDDSEEGCGCGCGGDCKDELPEKPPVNLEI